MTTSHDRLKIPNRRRWKLLVIPAAAAGLAALAACGSSGNSSHIPVAAGSLRVVHVGSATVLTSTRGFTLYSFAPDTPSKSNCNGPCAVSWPPVKGHVPASGIKGTLPRSSDLTARRRRPSTGIRCTPSWATRLPGRRMATASTRSGVRGTKSPHPGPRPPAARHLPGAAAPGTEPGHRRRSASARVARSSAALASKRHGAKSKRPTGRGDRSDWYARARWFCSSASAETSITRIPLWLARWRPSIVS
jgi:hypothetical protein